MDRGNASKPTTIRWIAALLGLAIIWGGSIPATKLGLEGFPPLTLTGLRYLAAAPLFGLLLVGRPLPSLRALAAMAGLGVLGIGVGQAFQALGVQRISASVATVISATIPILIVLFAALRLRQRVQLRHAFGLASAFVGVALVATGDPRSLVSGLGDNSLVGDALILGSALAIAVYYTLSIELVVRYSAVTVAAWTSLAGALAMIPLVAWEMQSATVRPSALGIAVVLYLGVLVTVLGVWVWLRALAHLPARIAAALQYLQPIVGVAASAALFGDRLDLWFAFGTALVFIGIALTTIPSRPAETAVAPVTTRGGAPTRSSF
jgi:O-acetylserine/cysteine efflux transporter